MRDLENWLQEQHWFIMARDPAHNIAKTTWLMAMSPAGEAWRFYGNSAEVTGWDRMGREVPDGV